MKHQERSRGIPGWAEAWQKALGRVPFGAKRRGYAARKILYVHVAKAGGTSFNTFLHSHFNGESHCEQYVEATRGSDGVSRRQLGHLDSLRQLDFISGHLPYPLLAESDLNLGDYMLVTLLRHPFAQTLSHLNWVIKISEDEQSQLFRNAEPRAKKLSQVLREVEDWSPDSVIHWLEQYPNWFQNNQSRYLVTPDQLSNQKIRDILDSFQLVGITERIDAFVSRFVELKRPMKRIKREKGVPFENRNSTYRVPSAILQDKKLREFLTEYNRIDLDTYTYVEQNLAP
jgi:hypothetical protein